jgi:3-methyladenine DNA glycosylase AlkD
VSGTATSPSPGRIGREIRQALAAGGSPGVAASSQRFFREPVQAYGWKTASLRRFVHERRRALIKDQGIEFLVEVADELFRPGFNEAKTSAIFLLEQSAAKLGDSEFRLFESWLERIENWSDHDGLTMYLLGPMMAAKPQRASRAKEWAGSRNFWKRRAAAVTLIRGLRRDMFWGEAQQVAQMLLRDEDVMVQKGLGWMLREAAKANGAKTIPFLLSIRERTSRLVLRTACETLRSQDKNKVLEHFHD